MDIGALIEQAARILWKHKFLAVLGVLDIIFTSSGLIARAITDLSLQFALYLPQVNHLLGPFAALIPTPMVTVGQVGELYRLTSMDGVWGWVRLAAEVLVPLIILAVIGIIIEGGIIAAVGEIAQEKAVSARDVFLAGWRRVLPMVVIASVPAIPLTIGATLVVAIGTGMIQGMGGLEAVNSPALAQQAVAGLWLTTLAVLCPLGLVTLPIVLLSVLAYRACMLESKSVGASLQRAWEVLRARPGPVLLLTAISYGISLLANAISYLPGNLALICLPAIILVWLVQGIARAFYLALWTLGWRTWTASNTGAPGEPSQA